MSKDEYLSKFGDHYAVNEHTYKLGINAKYADHLAKRFKDKIVLETCTGGGFTSIHIAKYAKHLYTVEINEERYNDAIKNSKIAGVYEKITFIHSDIFDVLQDGLPHKIEAAFLDPDWSDDGEDYEYKFVNSNTKPPSDLLLDYVFKYVENVTLIQPPYIDKKEFANLPEHEFEKMYSKGNLDLYCLHFGELMTKKGVTEFHI